MSIYSKVTRILDLTLSQVKELTDLVLDYVGSMQKTSRYMLGFTSSAYEHAWDAGTLTLDEAKMALYTFIKQTPTFANQALVLSDFQQSFYFDEDNPHEHDPENHEENHDQCVQCQGEYWIVEPEVVTSWWTYHIPNLNEGDYHAIIHEELPVQNALFWILEVPDLSWTGDMIFHKF